MVFDSEEQKQRVLDMIGEVPVTTNIKGLLSGASPDLMDLVGAIQNGIVMEREDQLNMAIWMSSGGTGKPGDVG